MDMLALFFPQGDDIIVIARYPEISDGTGQEAKFYYKPSKETPDDDSSVIIVTSPIVPDEDYPGQTMSTFFIDSTENEVPGAYWWKIRLFDSLNNKRTANCGPLLVEAS